MKVAYLLNGIALFLPKIKSFVYNYENAENFLKTVGVVYLICVANTVVFQKEDIEIRIE